MRQGAALRILNEYAAGQWGMVTAAQAAGLGVERATLTRMVAAGLLEHVMRGVYGIPAALTTPHLAERAVWLRLDTRPAWERPLDGTDAMISHQSAAAVHDLGDLVPAEIELTVPRRRTTRDPAVRLRVGRLTERDVATVDGLPVTTVERTVLDLLADHTDGSHVGDVLAAALDRRLVDLDQLGDRAAEYAARYGVTGVDRGRRLLERLLDEIGYDGADRYRRLASLARQLADLDDPQLDRLSAALREIRRTGE